MGGFVKPPKIIALLGKQGTKTCDHTVIGVNGSQLGIVKLVCYPAIVSAIVVPVFFPSIIIGDKGCEQSGFLLPLAIGTQGLTIEGRKLLAKVAQQLREVLFPL